MRHGRFTPGPELTTQRVTAGPWTVTRLGGKLYVIALNACVAEVFQEPDAALIVDAPTILAERDALAEALRKAETELLRLRATSLNDGWSASKRVEQMDGQAKRMIESIRALLGSEGGE